VRGVPWRTNDDVLLTVSIVPGRTQGLFTYNQIRYANIFNPFSPTLFSDCGKMSLYQGVQRQTGLTHPFLNFGHSGTLALSHFEV